MNKIYLNKEDNLRFIKYIEDYNHNKPMSKKIFINIYINSIEFLSHEETKFNCETIEPIMPHGYIKSDIIPLNNDIGKETTIIIDNTIIDNELVIIVKKFINETYLDKAICQIIE